MHTYFISDLHLSPERPQTIQAFLHFLQGDALGAERLYILGDLFEFWIGDDAAKLLGAETVLKAMKGVSKHVDCFFIAGNRDFLVRDGFSAHSGFNILPDESIIDLYGTRTLILHGDSLCTDDVAHQEFRTSMMTNLAFCEAFLKLEIPQRIEKAKLARMESHQHKSSISMEIMDVTQSAVLEAFEAHKVQQMIHGHTHRQNTHRYTTKAGDSVRYVLGDWHTSSSIMRADKNGLAIHNAQI